MGKVKLICIICTRSIQPVQIYLLTHSIVHFFVKTTRLWTYLLRDSVFTQSIPVLRRSVMVSQHVVFYGKYHKNV